MFTLLFASSTTVLASEGDGEPQFEMEVHGYHVGLSSAKEWIKGENAIIVTIADSMGMPVSDADVKILITPKAAEHTQEDTHAAEPSDNSMPGMDMGEPEPEPTEEPAHEEEVAAPLTMTESHEHGEYNVTTHLESPGEHDVQVFFHVDGEMLQADFVIDVPGMASKTIVLWSFVAINFGLVASAGVLKKQTIPVKGK
ncbi:MAG TPA: FixH family protein [Anaerolineales bacterium]